MCVTIFEDKKKERIILLRSAFPVLYSSLKQVLVYRHNNRTSCKLCEQVSARGNEGILRLRAKKSSN